MDFLNLVLSTLFVAVAPIVKALPMPQRYWLATGLLVATPPAVIVVLVVMALV